MEFPGHHTGAERQAMRLFQILERFVLVNDVGLGPDDVDTQGQGAEQDRGERDGGEARSGDAGEVEANFQFREAGCLHGSVVSLKFATVAFRLRTLGRGCTAAMVTEC